MNLKSTVSTLTIASVLLAGGSLFAQSTPAAKAEAKSETGPAANAGKLIPVTEKDAAWAAEQRKSYKLNTCVVSGEKLGSMGKADEYIYRAAGQPDRLVVFCCSGCEEDFLDDPAKYLAKIDAASGQQAKPASGKKHGEHSH